ncbi:MAG: hypothetical protein R2713_19880 [Ilumatobacteraceae bacterium]
MLACPGESVSGEIEVISADNTVETLEIHAVNLLDDPEVSASCSRRATSRHTSGWSTSCGRADDAVAEAARVCSPR